MAGSGQDPLDTQHAAPQEEVYPFRFVEVGQPSLPRDEDRRSAIRSHVMRDFYEKKGKKRRPGTQPEVNSAASEKEGAAQQINRFKISAQGLQEVKKRRDKRGKDLHSSGKIPKEGSALSKAQNIQASRLNNLKPIRPAELVQFSDQSPPLPSDSRSRQKRDSTTTSGSSSTSRSASSSSRSRLPLEPLSTTGQDSGQLEYFSLGSSIDPFDTLPLCGQRTQVLLYHAHRTILAARIMGQLRTEWLELATRDVSLYYLALSHYAGNYGLANHENDPVEAVRFRSEAIRIVNEKLGDMTTALADATVSTVASLSSYEATNGTPEGIRTHLEGLQRLVGLKGGIQCFDDPYRRRLILWADLNCANALGTNPLFDDSDTYENLDPWPAAGESSSPKSPASSGSTIRSPTEIELLSQELRDNFASLKELTLIDAGIARIGKPKKVEAIRYSDRLYKTERSLLTLANKCGPHKFVTCGCLAAIIYLDNQFRGISFKAVIMQRFLDRLRASMASVLQNTLRRSRDDNITRAMLWVLFVGGLAAAGRPDQAWFVEQIIIFLRNFDANTWEDIESVLKGFLWPSSWEQGGSVIWAQIRERLLFQSTVRPGQDAERSYVDAQREAEVEAGSEDENEESGLEFGANDLPIA